MPLWAINTQHRLAMFIAQCLHESRSLNTWQNLAMISIWANTIQAHLRKDSGNTPEADGDGQLYKGRGLIQITDAITISNVVILCNYHCLKRPELLENPRHAVASACWFWADKNLIVLLDNNQITACTRVINGDTNGLKRKDWLLAKATPCVWHSMSLILVLYITFDV